MGDKEVHGDILTVDVLVHHVPDGLGHHIRIQVGIILVKEGSARQHHGQLTGVVGIVEPGLVWYVPRMVPARETHNAITCFSPHPKPKHDFIMAEVSIIVDGQYGLCLNLIPGQEPIVQTVLLSTDDHDGDTNVWPQKVLRGQLGRVPHHHYLVQVGEAVESLQEFMSTSSRS